MNPLIPLWVSGRIRLLVLGLEDTHDLAVEIPRKVAARAALRDHEWVHALLDGGPHAVDNDIELGLGHVSGLGAGEHLGRDGADALGRLEDGVVDLETLVVLAGTLGAPALELARDLVGPPLQASVDGFEVDSGVGAHPAAVLAAGGPAAARKFGARHARVRARLGDGFISGGGSRLEGGGAVGQGVVIRVVTELFGLGEAFVACRGRPVARHVGGVARVLSEFLSRGEDLSIATSSGFYLIAVRFAVGFGVGVGVVNRKGERGLVGQMKVERGRPP